MLTTHDDTYRIPCETDSNNSPTSNHVYTPLMGASRAKKPTKCSRIKECPPTPHKYAKKDRNPCQNTRGKIEALG